MLFDGDDLGAWSNAAGETAAWKLVDGAMEVTGSGSNQTRASFGDCQLHSEWRAPPAVESSSQGRGNSGVFFMGRYELQVLDSFDNKTYADGQAAALYGQTPPLVNACRKPGEWQSYDVVFHGPRFEGEALAAPARITVFHNGVLVHDDVELIGKTAHRTLPSDSAHGEAPLVLQDHGNPVRYRNVWIRRLCSERDETTGERARGARLRSPPIEPIAASLEAAARPGLPCCAAGTLTLGWD